MHLGAHVPITGGVFNAPGHGRAIGAEAIQIFTRPKRERGSRVDRHARTGQGFLGRETFARIVNDRRFRGLPVVVETPGPLAERKKEIARLRALVRPAPPARLAPRARP
jgi:endonuclease IV